MATPQFIPYANCNGTSKVTHLLDERRRQALRLIMPRDLEKRFGAGISGGMPSKGYTDSEWYWKSADGCVWGIGWRWGEPRLRGQSMFGPRPAPARPISEMAAEFVDFLIEELVQGD